MAKSSAIDLRAIGGVDVQVDQPGGGMPGFESNTDFLDRNGIVIDPKDEVRPQQVAGFAFDRRIHEMYR